MHQEEEDDEVNIDIPEPQILPLGRLESLKRDAAKREHPKKQEDDTPSKRRLSQMMEILTSSPGNDQHYLVERKCYQ